MSLVVPGLLDLLDQAGDEVTDSGEPPGLPEYMEIPAGSGTRPYTVVVIPFLVAGTTGTITVSLVQPPDPPTPVVPTGLPPRFQEHVAPRHKPEPGRVDRFLQRHFQIDQVY